MVENYSVLYDWDDDGNFQQLCGIYRAQRDIRVLYSCLCSFSNAEGDSSMPSLFPQNEILMLERGFVFSITED